jgi:CheY-like chemotaxis protein
MSNSKPDYASGYLILIVDDEQSMRASMREYLQRIGFRVIEAADGEAGIAAAIQHRPQLILMNYMMPRLDGLRATRRIRQIADLKRVPIILNSACSEEEMRAPALAAGCNDFFELPNSLRALEQKILANILVG